MCVARQGRGADRGVGAAQAPHAVRVKGPAPFLSAQESEESKQCLDCVR